MSGDLDEKERSLSLSHSVSISLATTPFDTSVRGRAVTAFSTSELLTACCCSLMLCLAPDADGDDALTRNRLHGPICSVIPGTAAIDCIWQASR